MATTGQQEFASDIGLRQNDEDMQRLLRARQWRWLVAARWQKAQLVLLIGIPALMLAAALWHPPAKPLLSFLAVIVTLMDIGIVDRHYRLALKAAARSSEAFDIALFRLEWNSLAAGKRPAPEDQSKAERAWRARTDQGGLANWYAPAVDQATFAVARLICQRTNLTYDSELREAYVAGLTTILVSGFLVLASAGVFSGLTFLQFVVGTWVPAAPFLFWVLRERFRQSDAVEANEPGIKEAEEILRRIAKSGCDEAECQTYSRLIQSAIFVRRSTTPMLFPGIYRLRRRSAEQSMEDAAKHWLGELGFGGGARR